MTSPVDLLAEQIHKRTPSMYGHSIVCAITGVISISVYFI